MARDGMAELITQVRVMAHAGTADHTVAGTTYWTDDQIQSYLDQHRVDYYEVPLQAVDEVQTGGSVSTTTYYMPQEARWIERYGTGSNFRLYKGDGTNAGTATYTVNYDARTVEFGTDTDGITYYLDFSSFDLNLTAADVWDGKAGLVAVTAVDWSTDNHSVKSSQLKKQYEERAQYYRSLSRKGVRFVRRVRTDEVTS